MQASDQNTDDASIEYYQIQCARCTNTFVWRQAFWQSRTPGSQDPTGYDSVSRAFCPHCGAIVCEGIGSSNWNWYRENQRLNANNPLPPALPSDLEWIPDNRGRQEFMKEFHQKWGKRQLPKNLWVPVSQLQLDLTLLRDFKEVPFRPEKAQLHSGFLGKLQEHLLSLTQESKKNETNLHEDGNSQIEALTTDDAEAYGEQVSQDSGVLPEGWFRATPQESTDSWKELQTELPKGHVLFRKPIRVIAHRGGATDDILCRHLDDPERYTVVHLTWSMKTETNEKFPAIEVDGSFEDFQNYEERSV